MSVTLTLGGVVFDDFEVPESIGGLGGSQTLARHKLLGGARRVDAIGPDSDDLAWTGRFRGPDAVSRFNTLDAMRRAGNPIALTWGAFSFSVIIATFTAEYLRDYEIPYRIVCVRTDGEQAAGSATQTVDSLVNADLGSVGSVLGDVQADVGSAFANIAPALSTVSSGLTEANTALSALGTLAGAAGSRVLPLQTALQSAQAGVQAAVTIGDGNILQGLGQVAGVIPGAASSSISNLSAQAGALYALSGLVTSRGLIGRAISNTSNAVAG